MMDPVVKATEGGTGVRFEEDTFVGVRDVRIHVRTWLPAAAPTGVVVIAHGFAEHSGRYAAVAERLIGDGIAVRAADHRGHGLSEGKRTSVVRFDDYVDDLRTVIAQARARWPSLHIVLLGHSMGGLIALDLAVRDSAPMVGLVVSAPAACPREVSRLTLAISRALSRVAPDTGVLRLPFNRISRDPAVVDAYNNDPLVFRTPIRARLGAEMLVAYASSRTKSEATAPVTAARPARLPAHPRALASAAIGTSGISPTGPLSLK